LLHALIYQSVNRTSKTKLVPAFREGGKILGRSLVEAPRWVSLSLSRYAERWLHTSGHPEAAPAGWPTEDNEEERTWLDRAAHTVDERLAALGSGYLGDLIDDFEARWRERPAAGS
jgi:hypothetical protein